MSKKYPQLVKRAMHQLPDLDQLEERLAIDPVGAAAPVLMSPEGAEGLESLGVSEAAAPDPETAKVLEAGTRAVAKVNKDQEGAVLTPDEEDGLEAIIQVFGRPAILIQSGKFATPPEGWEVLEEFRAQIEGVLPSVGRIEEQKVMNGSMIGTGFLVADDVIMTNRHVARVFSVEGLNNNWKLKVSMRPVIDYIEEEGAETSEEFRITEVIGIHETLDMALLRVEKGAAARTPLTIASKELDLSELRQVYLVGYPATDNGGVTPPEVLLRIFANIFQKKRLQPGELSAVFDEQPIMAHDCSTLGGNSGSCVLDLQTGQVIGLHFRGEFQKANHAVALWKLTDDPLLKKAKVNFA